MEGHLLFIQFLPFIESVGNNQASVFLKGISKTRFYSNGFSTCIEHLVAYGRVFCPCWYESPPKANQSGFIIMNDGGNLLTWRDVITRSIFQCQFLNMEGFFDNGQIGYEGK